MTMYEAEVRKLEELTERLKGGKDISYEEADWISKWVVPDGIARKFSKADLGEKIEEQEMQEPLKRWFEAVYEAMCSGRTGAFKNTIPLYYSSLDINDVLTKCLSKLKPFEMAISIETSRSFFDKLSPETQSYFTGKAEIVKNFNIAVKSARACMAERIGLNPKDYLLISEGEKAVICDFTYHWMADQKSDREGNLISELRRGGKAEIKASVVGNVMYQTDTGHVLVNSFSPNLYYDEAKHRLCWENYFLYVFKKDLTKLKPYLDFSENTLVNMILSSDRIPQSEKDPLDGRKTNSYPFASFRLVKIATELVKEEILMSDLEKEIQKEKKTITDSDDWIDIIR